jgi:two-component system response regulator DevR
VIWMAPNSPNAANFRLLTGDTIIRTKHTRVLVVDDHELVRIGLRDVLRTVESVEVVGEVGTVAQALALVQSLNPDIVLLDMRLPDGNGPDACRAIRAASPNARVIMVTAFADDVMAAIHAGASGYVLKTGLVAELLDALRVVQQGEAYLSPTVTHVVLDQVRTGAVGSPMELAIAQLTAHQRRILQLIADGKTNAEIGESINLTEHAAKMQIRDLMSRLGVRRRSQLAAIFARLPKTVE